MSSCPLDADPARKEAIARGYPKLTPLSFSITSYDCLSDPENKIYNCIAWAVGKTDAWWWPGDDAHWPQGVPNELSLDAFISAIRTEGYELRAVLDTSLEDGIEKVAIFVDPETKLPTHAARQKDNGRWTSKLGPEEDIEHDLHDLTGTDGDEYGDVAAILARPRILA